MRKITLKAPAKINLGLSILRKLPSGYHRVKTVFTQVSLYDTLTIKEANKKIRIFCDDKSIPTDKRNLVYQAFLLLREKAKIKKGATIFIKKRIPKESGLGGGSSDAARTLVGLNKLWCLNLSSKELEELAQKIGMDVCYQLRGGVKLEIQGEKKPKFKRLKNLPKEALIVLCFPGIFIKSSWAYQKIEYDKIGKDNLTALIQAINNQDLLKIGQNLHNDFELWTSKKYPLIKKIKEQILSSGALGSLMSGKGSAVFGIFNDFRKAKFIKDLLKKDFKTTFLVKPI